VNRVTVVLGLLPFTLDAVALDPGRVLDGRSLVEVRTLDGLPREVNTRPFRRDGPLRAENINDEEVREIQT
jgi:hypothetical protein